MANQRRRLVHARGLNVLSARYRHILLTARGLNVLAPRRLDVLAPGRLNVLGSRCLDILTTRRLDILRLRTGLAARRLNVLAARGLNVLVLGHLFTRLECGLGILERAFCLRELARARIRGVADGGNAEIDQRDAESGYEYLLHIFLLAS